MTDEAQVQTIDRPPRIQPELPMDKIEIPSPPERKQAIFQGLMVVAQPLIAIMGYISLLASSGSGRSLIRMALMVVGSTGVSCYYFIKKQQQRTLRKKARADHSIELNKQRLDSSVPVRSDLASYTVEAVSPQEWMFTLSPRAAQILLPLTTITGYLAMTAFGSWGRSPLMISAMALMVVGSASFSSYSVVMERARRTAAPSESISTIYSDNHRSF